MQRMAAIVTIIGVLAWGYWIGQQPSGNTLVFALASGAVLGITFQRSRFCFYCHARDWFENKDPRGMLSIVLALAIGTVGYTVIMGSWLADPSQGHLPPDLHIGPVSWVLVAGGIVFGTGMVISGSCISAHWYRLSEGSVVSPFALIGSALGFVLGFKSWNFLYSHAIADAPVVWLPTYLGYGGALLLQLTGLTVIAIYLWRGFASASSTAVSVPRIDEVWQQLWQGRWSYWSGGLIVGLVSATAIIRMKPLGVTAMLGSLSRQWADFYGWIPSTMHGLDGFAGCATTPQASLLTPNAVLLSGIVGGAFIASLMSQQFKFQIPGWRDVARGLTGGVLLGWGSMVGLGCTIGTLLSGSHAGALSGWIFGVAMFFAIWAALKIKRMLHTR